MRLRSLDKPATAANIIVAAGVCVAITRASSIATATPEASSSVMSHLSISARVDEPTLTCSWGIVHEIRVARNARVVVARDDIYAVWVCRALERRDNIADHSISGDAPRGRLDVVWDLSANYKYCGYKKMDDKSHGNGHAPPRGRSERPHLGCNPIASGAYTSQGVLYSEPGTS